MISIYKRPKLLSEILDQRVNVKGFARRSVNCEFPYYMLFHGKSGTGKTSCAMILAKLINCKQPVLNSNGYYEPCNQCDSCEDINKEAFNRDTHMLDGSKIGKEEIKKIAMLPFRYSMYDKHKIVIIDEAHLLASPATKGALLKMLERMQNNKNSSYVILCTTEVGKLPQDVKSRLVQYYFHPLNEKPILCQIEKVLRYFKDPDKISKELRCAILPAFAKKSRGDLRVAYNMLDRCINEDISTIAEAEEAFNFKIKPIVK